MSTTLYNFQKKAFPFFLFILLCFIATIKAQDTADYYDAGINPTNNKVYGASIKTVQLTQEQFELSNPELNLQNPDQRLKLSFDDFEGGFKQYNYTLIHCNANWQPSQLFPAEYILGFIEENITRYNYSVNTLIKYTHYETVFPTENMKITKSGNYLLKVYKNQNPEDVVIIRRFIVYTDYCVIAPNFHRPSINADRNYKQEIDFTLNYRNLNILDVFSDIKITLLQNNRWDNAVNSLKPTFVNNNQLTYDYDRDNVFSGGNEFRYFDTRNLTMNNERVIKVEFKDSVNHVYLTDDVKRAFKRYSFIQDIKGRYYIKNAMGYSASNDADYVQVHFYLNMDKPYIDGDIYIYGALTDWNYDKKYKLVYDDKLQQYKSTLLLKQGYYNYEYVYLNDKQNTPDDTEIEGSFYDTENDYAILVYARVIGTSYDQLIGFGRFNTMR